MSKEIQDILKRLERLESKETPTVKPVDLSAFVDLTSNQSVGGVKTFTSIPLLPSSMPTLNNQAANKAYVDSVAGDWSSWTPTLVGWSSTTLVACRYLKMGKIMFFSAIISGTSNSTSTSFTLPETNAGSERSGAMGWCTNNGTAFTTAGRFSISTGSNVCRAYTDMAVGTWTASGTKRVSVYGWIAIN